MIKTRFIAAIGLLTTLVCCSNSGTDETPGPNPPTPPTPPATGDYVSVQNGKLYAPDGGELSLWGVNFQPCLSWEYNDRLKRHGIPETAEALKRVAEKNLDEVAKLKVSVIRCHLTPADFTDAEGNLVETPYLDVLDYMVAGAAGRGIYITLAFINHMGSGYVPNSVFMTAKRQEWVHDKEVVRKSKNYIRQLLARKNNYSGTTYAAEKHIALWELINEPEAFSYTDIQSNPPPTPISSPGRPATGSRTTTLRMRFSVRNSSGIISTACTTSSGRPGRSSPSSGATTGTVTATATRIFSKAPSPRRPKPWPAATIRGRISCHRTTGAIPKTSRRRIIRAGSTSISTT